MALAKRLKNGVVYSTEIDPKLLRADSGRGCDYVYRGELVLPNPEHN